jgi:hypothetical protein
MDCEFAAFVTLATVPLRRLEASGLPTKPCSGTIVDGYSRRILLTASHAVRPDEQWAVEIRYDSQNGTQLYRLGAMQYVMASGYGPTAEVDLAFCIVGTDFCPRFQCFNDAGVIAEETPRIVLKSDLRVPPRTGIKYGFSGTSGVTLEPRPPALNHAILSGRVPLELGLTFLESDTEYDIFQLGHAHPGHSAFRGCSGAPIISEEGDLVGLLVGGCESTSTIRSLPLRRYASAVAAGIQSSVNSLAGLWLK